MPLGLAFPAHCIGPGKWFASPHPALAQASSTLLSNIQHKLCHWGSVLHSSRLFHKDFLHATVCHILCKALRRKCEYNRGFPQSSITKQLQYDILIERKLENGMLTPRRKCSLLRRVQENLQVT